MEEETNGKSCCCEAKKTIREEREKRVIKNRLNRIAGQIGGISKMIDEDRYCDDVLIQLSAVEKAVRSLAGHIIERHLSTCVVRDIKNGKTEIINEVVEMLKRFQ